MVRNLPQLTATFNGSDAPPIEKTDAPELPERDLFIAILADAIRTYRREVKATAGEYAESCRWFHDPARGLVSLNDVADVLGLAVLAVQVAVLDRRQGRAAA